MNLQRPYIAIICLLFIMGCKQEEVITLPPYDYPDEGPEVAPVLWQVNLSIDTAASGSMIPVVYQDKVFCSAAPAFEPSKYFFVNSDGIKYWVSDDAFEADCSTPPKPPNMSVYAYNDLLAFLCNSDPRVIDLNTGEIIWHYEVPGADHGQFMSGFGDKIFHTHVDGVNPYNNSTLVMGDILTGTWDTVFYTEMIDGYSVDLHPPGTVIQDNGDTIVVFHNRMWLPATLDERSDLYAYNMTADTLMWHLEDVDPAGGSTVWSPQIYDGKVYFQGLYSIMCFALETGNIIWTWESGSYLEALSFSGMHIDQDKIYIATYTDNVYALNAQSGAVIWQTGGFDYEPSPLTLFEDVLYFSSAGSGLLYAVDALTGQVIKNYMSPNAGQPISISAKFKSPVTIDPVLRRMYITDSYFLLCIPLN